MLTDCPECPGECGIAVCGGKPDMGPPDSPAFPDCPEVLAEYRLNETEGTTMAASPGGPTYDGMYLGDAGIQVVLGEPGPAGFGDAARFVGGYALVPALRELPSTFTLELMVAYEQTGWFLRWYAGGFADAHGLVLSFDAIGRLSGSFCLENCEGLSFTGGDRVVDPGAFVHVAVVRDGTQASFFLDGVQVAPSIDLGTADPWPVDELRLGSVVDFEGSVAWTRLRTCAAAAGSSVPVPAGE
jgi:hypothetical protein